MKKHSPLWNWVLVERQLPESKIILPETAGQEHYKLLVREIGPAVRDECPQLEIGSEIETVPNARVVMFVDEERKDLALIRASDIACIVSEVTDAG